MPHGVFIYEVPTSLVSPVQVDSALPVVFGTAPIHLSADRKGKVNEPVLVFSYQEAVEALGFDDNFEEYTLSEFTKSQFALYGVAPVVLVNALDPNNPDHVLNEAEKSYEIMEGKAELGRNVLFETVKVKSTSSGETLVEDVDFVLTYDKKGRANLSIVEGGALASATECFVEMKRLNPAGVTADDIVGGVDITTGKLEGLELVESVFPLFRKVPGLLVAPKFSKDPMVAAVMSAKADSINSVFRCLSLVDIPSDAANADRYTKVSKWKNDNNYVFRNQVACWGNCKLGDDIYHMSTQLAGLLGKSDSENQFVPYRSPSNQNFQMNAHVNDDGEPIYLTVNTGGYLNDNGVVTALNFIGGWKCWGNRTAIYPANTDPKDMFIPIRRMFIWIGNTLVSTFWQKVDFPITRRLIETIIDSVQIWLNGLASQGYLVGDPKIAFLPSENPITDLMNGIIRFHITITPPSPAEDIRFILEYDPKQLESLFG